MTANPKKKYRADYRPPAYFIDTVDLNFDIRTDYTDVRAVHAVRRNDDAAETAALQLDGRGMTLLSIAIDGRTLDVDDYALGDRGLTIRQPPARFELAIENRIEPDDNLSLEGLYRSGDILCTQCEATGFSRITYFPDRPDVMARYTTRVEADARQYPVLLANGNCSDHGAVAGGRHYAVFEDPFAKPCYLFALVAGDLGVVRDRFTTKSGRDVDLRLYTVHGHEDQCDHAMASI